ncbi:hypothetical protein DSO57_1013557 [Entomophthora muscae]|uniref:Uncharacterized protein n=1 Tax=Entomophthora muscae TaxID=34485 RepID=A0ACC2RKG6_9FUNG|nr:hypothetical protein DSO57_1013557 [Entomophthora muscae]
MDPTTVPPKLEYLDELAPLKDANPTLPIPGSGPGAGVPHPGFMELKEHGGVLSCTVLMKAGSIGGELYP